MFDGNSNCAICDQPAEGKKRKQWLSLNGYSYVFCDSCWQNRKNEVDEIIRYK